MTRPRPTAWQQSQRILLFCLFGLAGLVAIVVFGGWWLSYESRKDWKRTKAELLA